MAYGYLKNNNLKSEEEGDARRAFRCCGMAFAEALGRSVDVQNYPFEVEPHAAPTGIVCLVSKNQ